MTVEYPDRQDILLQFIAYRIQTLPRVRFTCLNFLGMLHAFWAQWVHTSQISNQAAVFETETRVTNLPR